LDEGGVAFAGMGIDAAYVHHDDQLCIAIGNFAGQPTTLHCQAQIGQTYRPDVFIEQSHRMGVAQPTLRMVTFGLVFFDANLDGWQDLFMVNGHVVNEEHLRNVPYAQRPQLFHNQGNGVFEEVQPTPQSGLDFRLIGRGAAYGDYDNDGDLDLLVTANQGGAHLLQNITKRDGHFVRIVTRGSRSNRDGIGARLRLHTNLRHVTRSVRTGGSYLSQSDMGVTFGLQPAEHITHLEVLWPSGNIDVLRTLPLDTTFVAREGTASTSAHVAQQPPLTPQPTAFITAKRLGIGHYRAGRREAAVAAFEQALQHQPTDYIVQQYLIELYWQQGARDKALALLTQMRQNLPEANFLMQFAFHLEDTGLHDLADAVYTAASQLDPKAPEALYRLGKNALQTKRYAAATTYFEGALARRADFLDALQGLGLAYAAQGKTAEAETQFHQVLRINPDSAEAYTQLGKLYLQTNRLAEALTAYQTVARLQPHRAQSYHNLGTVLAAQGQVEAAMQQFQAALRHDPRFVPAHNDLGTLYAEHGALDRAIESFRTALTLEPAAAQTHYNLGMAYASRGEMDGMIRELRETLRLAPTHAEAHLNLGVASLQQGQHDAALQHFHAIIRTHPQHADAHYFIAVTAAQLGHEETMRDALLQAIRLEPRHAKAHSALASFYFQRRDYERAWTHGTQAAQLGAPVQQLLEALRQIREQH
jgi:tetratricopeptide (TPR) repeat protein